MADTKKGMIQASELRIGNLLHWCHEESESIIKVDLKVLSNFIYNEEDPNDSEDRFARVGFNYHPIELTERLLVDCGDLSELCLWKNGDAIYFPFGRGEADVRIKYLHQLQNLYHSLTGQELTINF